MSHRLRVVIADDHPLFREGVRSVLQAEQDIDVVGESSNGSQSLSILQTLTPDILVTDLDMPVMGGLDLIRAVQERNLPVAVVVLTMYDEEDMFNEAMDLGVKGYVLKENAVQDIVAALRAVSEGRHYISPSLSDHLVGRGKKAKPASSRINDLETLTSTERRVLGLIAEQKTSREIGSLMFISPKTVENHRTNICSKLGLHGSHSLLKFAIEHRREL